MCAVKSSRVIRGARAGTRLKKSSRMRFFETTFRCISHTVLPQKNAKFRTKYCKAYWSTGSDAHFFPCFPIVRIATSDCYTRANRIQTPRVCARNGTYIFFIRFCYVFRTRGTNCIRVFRRRFYIHADSRARYIIRRQFLPVAKRREKAGQTQISKIFSTVKVY